MSSTKILSLMLDELHKRFLAVTTDLSEDDFTFKTDKNSPAIGWTIGHLTGGQHVYLRLIFLGEPPSQIQEYESFNTGTDSLYTNVPSFKKIVAFYESEFEELKKFIETLTENDLNSPTPHREKVPPFFQDTPLREILVSYIAHAFTHLGQIIEIRRMLGKDISKINE
ncbi:MAG: DinB family protein [Candidatus Heimdallarchaeota archaeon]|nr:MAG: DinB family protein [Candidatus Heimdallarchaeota archaeon]